MKTSVARAHVTPWIAPSIVAATALVTATIVAVLDPSTPGNYPTCPVKSLTGYSCPGCGSLRALHALVHGRLIDAVHHNPLAMMALPALIVVYLMWLRRIWTRNPRRATPAGLAWALLIIIALFSVTRNLPGVTWLGR